MNYIRTTNAEDMPLFGKNEKEERKVSRYVALLKEYYEIKVRYENLKE